ncbi:MAG TPA: hypothetical protein VG895_01815 [Patescibacteria group bacterium]|nr:hypothetical protein [Patescibacteria group bacterium]
MTPDTQIGNSDFDELLTQKSDRLPEKIRRYFQNMQNSSGLSAGLKLSKEKPYTKLEIARLKLAQTLSELLSTNDKKIEVVDIAKTFWLLNAVGDITSEERRDELSTYLDSLSEDMSASVSLSLPNIRDEISPLIQTDFKN